MIAALALAILPTFATTTDAEPDIVVLAGGKEVSCRVLYEDDTKVVYRARRKNREVPREEVESVRSIERSLREFLGAYDAVEAPGPEELVELATFCEQRELHAEARNLWIRILTLDPVHEGAWTKLGGVESRKGWRLRVRGRFYTIDELRERASDWKNAMELPTAHFLVRTDIAPEQALDVTLDVERAYLAFYELLGPVLELYPFDEVPEIHIFSDANDYPKPPTPGRAWFSPVANTLYVDASTEEALTPHEVVSNLTYGLLANAFQRTLGKSGLIAPWARRGMAESFGLAARRDAGHASWDFGVPYLPYFRAQAGDPDALDLRKLVGAGFTSFDSGSDQERYVRQSYTLTFFLVYAEDGAHRAGFAEYLRSSFGGQGAISHLSKALGMEVDALERAWTEYVAAVAR
ncbi:MAG: hypothetical protein AAF682_16860 [Planctomycetota bacterium]